MAAAREHIETSCGSFEVIDNLRENDASVQTLKVVRTQISQKGKKQTSEYLILKRLIQKDATGLAGLRREAKHLKAIAHHRVPTLISTHLEDEANTCLVMKHIEGIGLNDWIKQGHTVTPKQLHRWLEQACKLLGYIHSQGLVHQDISPNNIILHNQKIHLIDFGGSLGTPPYAAPELSFDNEDTVKAHTPQTDFYALGKTFQHLLFGRRWTDTRSSKRQALQKEVSTEFEEVANIIYWMTEASPGDRPISADQILTRIHTIKPTWQKVKEKRQWLPAAIALATCALTLGLRQANLLQSWELSTYDQLTSISAQLAPEPQDDRLVVITINKEDLNFQVNHPDEAMTPKGEDDSISDAALNQLMTTLLADTNTPPAVVALDLRRDKPISPDYPYLKNLVKNSADSPLLLVCHVAGADNASSEPFAPPTDVSPQAESITFSDLPAAQEGVDAGVIRRAALAFESESTTCPAFNSLAFAAATRYFWHQGFHANWNADTYDFEIKTSDPNSKTSILPFLPSKLHVGGYRLAEDYGSGNQLFIHYRRRQKGPSDIATHLSLTQVLTGDFPPNTFDNKVVLIGVDRKSTAHIGDRHPIPQGERIAGVFIHANIISQIISYVEDERPLIWALSQGTGDRIVVLAVSLCSGLGMAWLLAKQKGTVVAIAYGISGVVILCTIALGAFVTTALWLPLVPAILAWTLSGTTVFVSQKYQEENPYAY